ncbi:LysR family transcriptional regulator [Streptomyces sp. NBC_01340]|uniref:LysR family transcriptional regulator n=1 Tax=unclassified Streptomyces TaxID=2593676 RepID=UPI00224D9D11|nr:MULTISPECIES: LysR family transcriptional regulator [unclassified Streptomyces]MCX4461964.1 LysR family transcriptional regulator [Streptomyces sp. NBC_01719]MCX4490872.1 LysR family transcriptional regulator [Streptomyces sp. NBC_01728]MCX4594546.1 LysR family transcriptional regulator [Streptomyces sp. NBC_01549]WSI36214.1 LysR family transcriptional regulator [Streptomyces sp. NBC_01340]
MELRHLEYFVAVAEELSFTGAARRLHVVQSGVSATIRALEKELDATLFERSSQRVSLTDAGAALLPEAHAALDAVRAARDAVRGNQGTLRGAIDIGAMTAVAVMDLPALLRRFRTNHPGVAIRLRVSPTGSAGLAQALAAGELDAAFLSLAGRTPGGLTVRQLTSYPMVLLVPTGHRLASRRRVALHELADEEFVDFPPGSGSRDLVDQAFTTAGVRRRVSVEADIASAAAYVRCGLGITLLPEFAVPDTPDLSVLAVGDETPRWTLSIATSSTRRPSAPLRALLELADAYASTAPEEPDLHDLGSGDRKSATDHKE